MLNRQSASGILPPTPTPHRHKINPPPQTNIKYIFLLNGTNKIIKME